MYQRSQLLCLSALVFLALSAATARADLARPMPWLNGVTTESVYVLVEANSNTGATVDFGLTTGYGSHFSTEYTQTTGGIGGGPSNYVHNIKLTGLLPNTQYHYRVTQGSSVTSDYSFWTAPLPRTPAKWGSAADPRKEVEADLAAHDAMCTLIASHDPRMMVYGGDLVDSWMYADWDEQWFRPNQNALNATTPWVNATGNHERWGFNEVRAFTQAPIRDGDDPAGIMGWYSFDYGDAHILIINNEMDDSPGSDQWNFAAADLAASKKQWKIVAFHQPAYSGTEGGDNMDMVAMTTQIFETNGVDIILTGHYHTYQHNLVNGIHHMVLGTFGVEPQPPTTASYTVYDEMTRNFGIIETTSSSLTLTTYRQNGTVIETIALSVPIIPGDINGDGWVGGADLTAVITNWGMSGAIRTDGDLSGDGTVGGVDYTEVITYWGTGDPLEPNSAPEPATLGLLLAGALTVLLRRPKQARP